MLRRENKLDQPQFGLVLELVNHDRDAAIRLQSEYSLTMAIGNLIPVASGHANSMDRQGSSRNGVRTSRILLVHLSLEMEIWG